MQLLVYHCRRINNPFLQQFLVRVLKNEGWQKFYAPNRTTERPLLGNKTLLKAITSLRSQQEAVPVLGRLFIATFSRFLFFVCSSLLNQKLYVLYLFASIIPCFVLLNYLCGQWIPQPEEGRRKTLHLQTTLQNYVYLRSAPRH